MSTLPRLKVGQVWQGVNQARLIKVLSLSTELDTARVVVRNTAGTVGENPAWSTANYAVDMLESNGSYRFRDSSQYSLKVLLYDPAT